MVIKLYPHILNCTQITDGGVIGGVPQPGVSVELSYSCRYRPNTSARSVRSQDGQTVIYRGTCYTPNATALKTGDVINVPGLIDEATVLQVYDAQMRTRIILM